MALMNAAAAFHIGDKERNVKEGIALAADRDE